MLETAATLTSGSTAGAFGQVVGTVDGLVNAVLDGKEFGTGEVAEATAERAGNLLINAGLSTTYVEAWPTNRGVGPDYMAPLPAKANHASAT